MLLLAAVFLSDAIGVPVAVSMRSRVTYLRLQCAARPHRCHRMISGGESFPLWRYRSSSSRNLMNIAGSPDSSIPALRWSADERRLAQVHPSARSFLPVCRNSACGLRRNRHTRSSHDDQATIERLLRTEPRQPRPIFPSLPS